MLEINLPLIAATFVANEIFGAFKEKYVKKEIKKLIFPEQEYIDELVKTINLTIDKYQKRFPSTGNFPFYQHRETFAILSNFILFQNENENILKKIDFSQIKNIDQPTQEQIEHFYVFFIGEIKNNEKLKDLYEDENYKSKIFSIYDDISSIKSTIDKFLKTIPEANTIIKKWIEQIHQNLNNLKVQTALEEINKFESEVLDTITISDQNKAFIYFVKGLCLNENFKPAEAYDYFAQASTLNPDDLSYKAWLLYFKYLFRNSDDVLTEVNEAIRINPFDPLLHGILTTESLKKINIYNDQNVPVTVQNKIRYKRIVYKCFLEKNLIDQALEYFNTDITNIDKELEKVTIDNCGYLDFYLQLQFVLIGKTIPNNLLLKKNPHLANSTEVDSCIKRIEIFIKALLTGEKNKLLSLFKYINHILLFFKNSAKDDLEQAYSIFQQNPEIISPYYLSILKPCFSQIGEYQTATKFFTDSELEPENYYYKSILYTLQNDETKSSEYRKLFLKYINNVDDNNINMVVDSIISLGEKFDEYNEFYEKLGTGKPTSNEFYNNLMNATRGYYDEQFKETSIKILETNYNRVKSELNKNEPALISYLKLLSLYKLWDGIITISDDTTNLSLEHKVLLIDALWYSKQKSNVLLDLLDKWRNSGEKQSEIYLTREIRLHQLLGDWIKIQEISINGIKLFPDSFALKYYLTISYLFLEHKEDYLREIEKLNILDFSFINFQTLINGLLKFEKFDRALNLSYEYAIKHKDAECRMFFFNIFIFNVHKINYQVPLSVEQGYLVLIEGNSVSRVVNEIDHKHIFSQLINKRPREKLKLITHINGQEIEYIIKGIIHKYDSLINEIQQEAETPEITGLPMMAFKFKEGATGEEMVKQLIDMFGKSGDERRIYIENKINEYKKGDISFLQITRTVFNDDILDAYITFTNSSEIGFKVLPITFFRHFDGSDIAQKFCLDFTSILFLANVFNSASLSFKQKFTISQHTLDYFKELLADIDKDEEQRQSYNVTSEGVTPLDKGEIKQIKLLILNECLQFIEKNCDITTSKDKLTLMTNLEELVSSPKSLILAFFDTITLSIENEAILISDEKLTMGFLHSHGNKIISCESYIQFFHKEYDKMELYELLASKNYIGIALSPKNAKNIADQMLSNSNVGVFF